jgi:protein-disulfide isomerase
VPRNRLLLLAGAAGLAIVVVVVVIFVAGSGGGGSDTTTTTAATSGSGAEAQTIFKGVPQQNDYIGDPSAPATMTVYADPQCPFCKQWDVDTLPTVMQNYVRTGKLRLRFRGIAIIGVNSVAGLRAIYAAGKQNKLWNMTTALYERQGEENSGWITIPVIKDAAREIGADPAQIVADADSKSVTAQLNASQADAHAKGINATPTFVIQKPLGQPQQLNVSGLDPAQFTPALDAALQ